MNADTLLTRLPRLDQRTNELGTEKLFMSMVGKRYRIRGFDKGVYVELWPKPGHTVWIEPDLIELVSRRKGRNITQRSSRRRVRTLPSRKHSARRG